MSLPRDAQFGYVINTSLIHPFHQDSPSSPDHLLRGIYKSGMKLRTTRRHRVESCFSRGFERISANNIISMYRLSFAYHSARFFLSFFIASTTPVFIHLEYLLPRSLKLLPLFFITSFLRGKSRERDFGLYIPRWNGIIDESRRCSTFYAVQFEHDDV